MIYWSFPLFPFVFIYTFATTLAFAGKFPTIANPFISLFIGVPNAVDVHIPPFPKLLLFAVTPFLTLSFSVYANLRLSTEIGSPVTLASISILLTVYVPWYKVFLESPLYGIISSNWKSGTAWSVMFSITNLYEPSPSLFIVGVSVSFIKLYAANFIIFIDVFDVLDFGVVCVNLSASIITEFSYNVPFSLAISMAALNLSVAISWFNVHPLFIHTNVVVPSELFEIDGSPYSLLLLLRMYFKPFGNVSVNLTVIPDNEPGVPSAVANDGFTAYVTCVSSFPKS